jgi:Protein of unknown function (DUF3684)
VRVKGDEEKQISSPLDLDEDDWDMLYDLKKAEEIIIADDTNAYQVFGDSIFTAPQEDILEGQSIVNMSQHRLSSSRHVGLYKELGSRHLSSLVKEDHQASMEFKDSKMAVEIRSLILQRLPLFLHEHTYARTRVSFTWLNSDKNFVTKMFGKITVTKTLYYDGTRLSRTQDASAVTKRIGFGPIQLWLAANGQLDMYE